MNYELYFVLLYDKMAMRRLKKKIFLGLFGGTVLLLGVVRLAFPEVTGGEKTDETQPVEEPVLTRENSSTHTRVLARCRV